MTKKTYPILNIAPESYKHFCCGRPKLDEYLKRFAKGNHKKGLGKTYILQEEDCVIGFYTISMGMIEFSSIPDSKNHGLPKYPIPVAKLGRLAVEERWKGRGIGKYLLIDAFRRIHDASQLIAAYGIVVDAKDKDAKDFYKHFGFTEYKDNPLSLFLPMETIQRLFLASSVT